MRRKIPFILLAFTATSALAELPVANGVFCPAQVADRGGEFAPASTHEKDIINLFWNGTENGSFAMQVDADAVPLTAEMMDACNAHPSIVAANEYVAPEFEAGFVNNKTPNGSNGDGKWYPEGIRSFDAGDVPMSRSDAEALGIEIGK